MLPDGDLVRLCTRLGLTVPVVSVDDDFHCTRGTNNFSSVAEVAKGSPAWDDDLQKLSLDEAGRILDQSGYFVVTLQVLGQDLSKQDIVEAQRLIIGLKEHYFILDRSKTEPAKAQVPVKTRVPGKMPVPAQMQVPASAPSQSQGAHCWN